MPEGLFEGVRVDGAGRLHRIDDAYAMHMRCIRDASPTSAWNKKRVPHRATSPMYRRCGAIL
eukprot:6602808-Pyramimonas_sp.AAC.1